MSAYIAVDIGGTQIRAALYGSEGLKPDRLARTNTKAPQDQPGSSLERLLELIASIWPTDQEVAAICVAAPGPINPYTGMLLEAPNIPGWKDLPLRNHLQDRFKVPVVAGNDANLAGLGEWKFGAGQGHHNILYLTISTGIGGGIIVDDHLLLGARGLAAEVGHTIVVPEGPLCGCGQRGHLEALASGTAIARWVGEQLENGASSSLAAGVPVTSKMVSEAAQQGDALSIRALERAGYYLGIAVANFLHIFNPTIVILGGGVSRSAGLLLDPMKSALKANVLNPNYLEDLTVTTAAFGDEAGLVGALALGRTIYPPSTIHD